MATKQEWIDRADDLRNELDRDRSLTAQERLEVLEHWQERIEADADAIRSYLDEES